MRTQTYLEMGGTEVAVNKSYRAVRIHHPTLRSCIFTITRFSRPFREPNPCALCGVDHPFSTLHFNLNEHGNVCVSEEVYQIMKDENLVEDIQATKEVIPAPTVINMPALDAQAKPLSPGEPVPVVSTPPVWQPPDVISREHGVVKQDGVTNGKEKP